MGFVLFCFVKRFGKELGDINIGELEGKGQNGEIIKGPIGKT